MWQDVSLQLSYLWHFFYTKQWQKSLPIKKTYKLFSWHSYDLFFSCVRVCSSRRRKIEMFLQRSSVLLKSWWIIPSLWHLLSYFVFIHFQFGVFTLKIKNNNNNKKCRQLLRGSAFRKPAAMILLQLPHHPGRKIPVKRLIILFNFLILRNVFSVNVSVSFTFSPTVLNCTMWKKIKAVTSIILISIFYMCVLFRLTIIVSRGRHLTQRILNCNFRHIYYLNSVFKYGDDFNYKINSE